MRDNKTHYGIFFCLTLNNFDVTKKIQILKHTIR